MNYAIFIYYYKNVNLFSRMFSCIYLESETYPGRSAEIFEINLLRTRCVYIENRISRESVAHTHLFWFLPEGKCDVYSMHDWFWKLKTRRKLAVH